MALHQQTGRGQLKIFFGYAEGTGKTAAMLYAARVMQDKGMAVMVGIVESHGMPDIDTLAAGFEQIPFLYIVHNGRNIRELNLDEALKKRPQLILVDELAHMNGEGCRHRQRYQDVEELLQAGIDVYTTVNVQNIESLADVIMSVSGMAVRDRIPDSVFDNADQVEMVDVEPEELMMRMQKRTGTYSVGELTAFREIALRRCADRVNLLAGEAGLKYQGSYHLEEHILVCLSSSPSNARIIRTAARMAQAFRGDFTALFVETSDFALMSSDNKKRLETNMHLARQLGAKIETVYGEDIPFQIAEFARISGVSRIVVGRSAITGRRLPGRQLLTDKLITYAPNLDIHIIPDQAGNNIYREKKQRKQLFVFSVRDILKCAAGLFLTTGLGLIFQKLGFTEANIITIYILNVLIISLVTENQIYSLISSIVSVFVFNFFFTEPRYTLIAHEQGYPVTFLVMFLASFIMGTLTAQLKNHAQKSARTAYRTKVLLDTDQLLGKADGFDEIIHVTAKQLVKLLGRDVVVYTAGNNQLSDPKYFPVDSNGYVEKASSEAEKEVALWVFRNRKHAGATTSTFSGAKYFYLAIRIHEHVYGVVGVAVREQPMESFETDTLLAILGECALALENDSNAREKEEAAVMARNEQLRANLLRAISHDLRTPLTSISGNASNLLANDGQFDEETRQQLYSDIYEDSMWLIHLVENLLAVTRIEGGRMNLRMSAELMDEVVSEALRHVDRRKSEHVIRVENEDEMLLAKMDARLIVQVVINIVDNAVKYTQEGSQIIIHICRQGRFVRVDIADDGPGIPDEDKARVFEMFYSGSGKIVDNRRSLGLGLALCKSIITAHGGEIGVTDHQPHGTVFYFTLPAEEVELHE